MNKIKRILLIFILSVMLITNLTISVQALSNYKSEMILKGDLPLFLRSSEINVPIKHVYHKYNGVEYPAYCLNEFAEGITADNIYSVDVISEITQMELKDEKISAIGLWRVIVNGYPYKTIKELGCESEQEAYVATQSAIYCYLANRSLSEYAAVDNRGYTDASIRTLEALKSIIVNADNSEEMPKEENKVFFGKAPDGKLQDYALTGIVEPKEEVKIEQKKLPVTGM